jgi:hypothetical protein
MDRECIPSVPKPRKRRTFGESEESPLAASSSTSQVESYGSTGAPVRLPRLESNGRQDAAIRTSLLKTADISHTGSRTFAQLLSQGLGIEHVSLSTLVALSIKQLRRSLGYNA